MIYRTLFLAVLLVAPSWRLLAVEVGGLRCEYQQNPLGIDVPAPRLSWMLDSDRQVAYQVIVDGDYQGWQKLHANTHKPAKATKKHPLTQEQTLSLFPIQRGASLCHCADGRRLGWRTRSARPRFPE